ncbi:MAG: alpha-L-arabinofuranosidase C-terminal domain-containing protein, partial [Christensenellaceae bacterium]
NFAACLLGLRQYNYCGKPVDLLKKFDITVVTTSGVDIRPQDSSDNWKVINRLYRDMIVDEHVYNSYQWFVDNSKRYDSYDRTGAKVFMGEYSVHTSADGRGRLNGDNNLRTALGEAVFLTGCERNSDVVRMTCYAPLFTATNTYRWTPDLIWFNPRDIMLTPNYYVQKYFAQFYGKYLLNDVAPVNNDNSGGLIIGGHRTTSAVRSVTVRSLATGEVRYTHSFKDGLGGWKVYPNCKGGYINAQGELVIEQSDAFNGYFFDDESFGNCEVEIDFRRVSGEQSFIAGVGAADIRDAGTMDCAGFSICCQYGKNHKGYDVSFDKRVDFIRTVCELMGKDKFFGYSAEGNKLRLVYTETKFKASFFKDGQWHEILDKDIWKVNERVFQSATFDEHGIYLKCVNVSGEAQDFEVNISSFGEMTKAHMYLLHDKDPLVTNEIGMRSGVENNIVPIESEIAIRDNKLCFHLEDNSFAVLVIE